MANPITTPRKLHQINWSKGMTDKDIRTGYVSELLNVEIRRGDRIESRASLEASDPLGYTGGFYSYVRMNGDPSGRNPDGWNLMFFADRLNISPWGENYDGVDSQVIELENNIDIETLEVAVVGATVYIASTDLDGDPNTVLAVSWLAFEGRFMPPVYIGEHEPEYGPQDGAGEWTVVDLGDAPMLNAFVNEGVDDSISSRSQTLNSLRQWLELNPRLGVGLYIETQGKHVYGIHEAAFEDQAAVSIYAVFTNSDGSISLPSQPQSLNIVRPGAFDIGYGVVVNAGLTTSVSKIDIYRKILTEFDSNTGRHDLIFSAKIADLMVEEDSYITPYYNDGFNAQTIDGTPDLSDPDAIGYTHSVGQADYGVQFSDDSHNGWVQVYQQMQHGQINGATPSTMKIASGWLAFAELRLFMPEHYYREGTFNINFNTGSTGPWYNSSYTNSLRITDRISLLSENPAVNGYVWKMVDAMILGGASGSPALIDHDDTHDTLVRLPNSDRSGNMLISPIRNNVDYRGYRRLGTLTVDDFGHHTSYVGPAASVHYGSEPLWSPTRMFGDSIAIFKDKRNPTIVPSLEDQLGGIDLSDAIVVRPFHIGAAGGRLFGLNVVAGGDLKPAELMYTKFGNFGTFSAANYISYGIRADGVGVAVSNIKSFIIAHHTAATYVFDIAGGDDFTWREVGSYKDTGCISNKLVCVTPFGVFWCSQTSLFAFNGRAVEAISEEIFETYIENIHLGETLTYREDYKQLWLNLLGGDSLVYDLKTAAWHKHSFSDSEQQPDSVLRSVFTVGSGIFLNFNRQQFSENRFYKLVDEGVGNPTFEWGVDTGYDTMGIPEIIKKLRRVYLYAVRGEGYDSTDRSIKIETLGDEGGETLIRDTFVDDKQIRQSASVRGYATRVKVTIESGGRFWKGKLDSLGVSYKPKKLK